MNRVFIDTNIFVNVLNQEDQLFQGSKEVLDLVHSGTLLGYTSVICISEILAGFYIKQLPEVAEKVLQNILSIINLSILEYNLTTAIEAAKIRGSSKVKIPDAIILSQAEQVNASLITRDKSLYHQKRVNCLSPEEFLGK
ncbi:MAG: type II toxin-antitoxin system VapC family toxin [Candidatus Kariarchaeaceae archaeon]